jgi:hypothetical protein
MNILSRLEPESKVVNIAGQEWSFPYKIWYLLELQDRLIICFSWAELEKHPPSPGFYAGCNIWCFDKDTKEVKWIIEEPPLGYINGKLWNRGLSPDDPRINRDECYMDISYSEHDDSLSADTTGARRFGVNPDDGTVKLIATGLK